MSYKRISPVSLALSILSAGTLAWAAVSCSESTNSGPSDSGSESGGSSSGSGSSSSTGSSSGGGRSSSSGGGSSSGADAGDAGEGGGACTGTAANQTLVDDMSASTGTAIKFTPPMCARKGTWFDYAGAGGGVIDPTPFKFSGLPTGLPADAGEPEAGPSDAGGGDGGVPGPQAACVSGATGNAPYSSTGMGFNLATTVNPDGGYDIPVAIDAHSHTGIEFWAWGALTDAGTQTQTVTVQVYDKNETPGFGICDPGASGGTACGPSQSQQMYAAGWHAMKIPFSAFVANPGYGDSNEMMLDPSTLTKIQWQVQLSSPDGGTPVPFDFCVYGVSFY